MSFSKAAKSSRASENSPSSIPSPTYQCTKARFEYIRSNLWSIREKTSAMAVELEIMHTARITFAKSPPGTTVGGWYLIPHLNPVGDQSTNWIVRLVLIVATAAFTSFGTTSPRYIMQQAMYFPWRGSHFTIIDDGSKTEFVISATLSCSWYAFSAEMIGAYDVSMKWMRGYGTKFVWNSVMSTLRAPSKRSDAVRDEMTCAKSLLRFVYVGRSISRLRRQMS